VRAHLNHAALLLVPLMAGMLGAAPAQSTASVPGQLSRTIATEVAGRGITVRVVQLAGSASVIGTNAGQDTLELGNTSYASERRGAVTTKRHPGYFTITAEFGLKLEPASGTNIGFAALSAYLIDPDPNCSYYLDGVRLTNVAQPIALQLRYGTVSMHRLEIRVPVTVPAGPLRGSIGWVTRSLEDLHGLS
jgi:hypothetical protein